MARFSALCERFPASSVLSLEPMTAFLKGLGNPHQSLPPVLHIAGTNGKGSTQAFLRAFLEAAGQSVHSYTSPHLITPLERITLASKPISEETFQNLLEEILPIALNIPNLSWFDCLTGLGFLAFSRVPADVLILETGLGGRLDSTNVLENPLATLITPLSHDHHSFLGNRLKDIAFEKAGILKPHVPLFMARQVPEVVDVLREEAHKKKCLLFMEGKDWHVEETPDGFWFQSQTHSFDLPKPALEGTHQLQNAGLSLGCLLSLFPSLGCQGGGQKRTLDEGLRKVSWPGRLQKLEAHPFLGTLPPGSEIWLDGAHNEGAAHALARTLRSWADLPFLAVSLLKSKDPESFLAPLVALGTPIVFFPMACFPKSSPPKGHPPETLAGIVSSLKGESLVVASVEAVGSGIVQRFHKQGPLRLLFCGSLYGAGDILSHVCYRTSDS